MRDRVFVTGLCVMVLGSSAASAQNLAPPEAFAACSACHSFKADENAVGPTLFKLANRQVGTVEGFRYSGPMKRSEFKWDAAHLEQFLSNPQAIVPGNRMPYSGLDDKAQLKILVNYLLTMGQ